MTACAGSGGRTSSSAVSVQRRQRTAALQKRSRYNVHISSASEAWIAQTARGERDSLGAFWKKWFA